MRGLHNKKVVRNKITANFTLRLTAINIAIICTLTISLSACSYLNSYTTKAPQKTSLVTSIETELNSENNGDNNRDNNGANKNNSTQQTSQEAPQASRITLPPKQISNNWPLQKTAPYSNLSVNNLQAPQVTTSIGASMDEDIPITSTPVIYNNLIFTVDGEGSISARNINALNNTIWRKDFNHKQQEDPQNTSSLLEIPYSIIEQSQYLGLNIAYGDDALISANKNGLITAIAPKNGSIKWQRNINTTISSAPLPHNDTVYIITAQNILYALDSNNGSTLWTHSGMRATTSLSSAPTPAIATINGKNFLFVPYSSGELYVLDPNTGHKIWGYTHINKKGYNSLLATNKATSPIISGRTIYFTAPNGMLHSLDAITGQKLWQYQTKRTSTTPWIAGNALYIIENNDTLLCLNKSSGVAIWSKQLKHHQPTSSWNFLSSAVKAPLWNRPIIANNKLLITGKSGEIRVLSPHNGTEEQAIAIDDNITLPPIIASNKIFLLSKEGDLISF